MGSAPRIGKLAMIARRHFLAGVGPCIAAGGEKQDAATRRRAPTIRFVLDWKYEGEHAQFTVPVTDGTYRPARASM